MYTQCTSAAIHFLYTVDPHLSGLEVSSRSDYPDWLIANQ